MKGVTHILAAIAHGVTDDTTRLLDWAPRRVDVSQVRAHWQALFAFLVCISIID